MKLIVPRHRALSGPAPTTGEVSELGLYQRAAAVLINHVGQTLDRRHV